MTSRYRISCTRLVKGEVCHFRHVLFTRQDIQIAACFSGLSSYLTENAIHFLYEGQSNVCTQVFRRVRKIAKSDY